MAITAASTVRLHRLAFQEQDGGDWIVGRPDNGEFVEVPAGAVTFLRALTSGDIDGAAACVRERHGEDIDALDFVETLVELGFVAELDGQAASPEAKPPSLPWLRPRHVRWVFRWPVLACVCALIVTGAALAAFRGDLIPSYRVYFLTGSQSVNLLWNTAVFLAAVAVHEFWHLAAARADGVYARIGLGTRLQFLVAQTTVTGIWCAPRRARLRVYLAGMTSDLAILAVCSLVLTVASPSGLACRALQALILSLLLAVANQFCVYMRTDMYFVLQDVLRCKNLYADAWGHLRYTAVRAARAVARKEPPPDPTAGLARRERVGIRLYSVLMIVGSGIAVAVFFCYEAAIIVTLFFRAGQHLVHGLVSGNPAQAADGALALAVEGTLQVIFLRLFFAKHAAKLHAARDFVTSRVRAGPLPGRG
jgi:hypothetical protein